MKAKQRIPKFIRELYHPTAREWLRWLRFKRKVIAIAEQGHAALWDYYQACAKDRRVSTSGFRRSGMYAGSSSSSDSLEMFEWASFTRRDSFQGTDLSVSCENHDGDFPTIASTNDW